MTHERPNHELDVAAWANAAEGIGRSVGMGPRTFDARDEDASRAVAQDEPFKAARYRASECGKMVHAVSEQAGDYRPTKLTARRHADGWYPAFEATARERRIVERATPETTAEALVIDLNLALDLNRTVAR